MANVNAPFGLRPIRYSYGSPYNGACRQYFATGASGVIAIGDPVIAPGGSNTASVQGYQAGSLPLIQIALPGDGDPITGVCVGVLPVTAESTIYRADSTDRIIFVADDPNLIFIGQSAAGTDWATTDVGYYANLLSDTASTVTGLSKWTLDATDVPSADDVSNQLRIIGLHNSPDNVVGEYAVWEVMINNHQLANVGDAGRFSAV